MDLTYISVPVPTKLFLDLAKFLELNKDNREPVSAISDAIDYWLDNASWKPELLTENSSIGYQWKSLFLPNDTQIRMFYKGKYFYAKVDGDQIVYNGESISPGSLANTIAGGSRNAWRVLWIKRPQDEEWMLSDDCRPENVTKNLVTSEALLSEIEALA